MTSTNGEVLKALRTSFPQLFTSRQEDGEQVDLLDLEKIRLLAGDGNYSDKFGLRWENKPEKFDADSVGKLPTLNRIASKAIHTDPAKPTHVLIEGDNYHALKVLAYTHERAVDVIEIDVPYNTGNKDFKYNDRFVDKEDGYRHSKWLSFMSKRLRLAKGLLKDTGVVFIHIDENEFAQLKLLCDEVFGEDNYVENFIWVKNSSKNDSKTTSCVHEYVLCYARQRREVERLDWTFRVKKKGLDEVNEIVASLTAAGTSLDTIEKALKLFYRGREDLKGVKMYDRVDAGGVFRLSDASKPDANGKHYEVLHPVSGKGVKRPAGGWRYSEATMADHIANNLIWFGLDHTTVPQFKRYLHTVETEVSKSVIQEFGEGFKEIQDLFGFKAFNNAKPTALLRTLLELVLPTNGVVLDFFAGSGTTAHAVMQMNAEDKGNRQCILVTNDEGDFNDADGNLLNGGICTHVTYPRLQKVIGGYTTPKGKEVAGLGGNLEFFKTAFQPVPQSRNQQQSFFRFSTALLCLKAGCFKAVEEGARWAIFETTEKHLFVLFDEYANEAALERLRQIAGPVDAYVFAYESDDDTAEMLRELPNVTVQEVPQPLLDLFIRLKE